MGEGPRGLPVAGVVSVQHAGLLSVVVDLVSSLYCLVAVMVE